VGIEKDGFEIVGDGRLGLDQVEAALESAGISRTRAGARHILHHREIAALAREPVLLEAARAVVGGGAVPFRATLFDKSPAANWLVAWHQDTALPLRRRHEQPGWQSWSEKDGVVYAHAPAAALQQVVAVRVHLDDSGPDNGPLRVLPRTHTLGVLTDEGVGRLSRELPAVECRVPRGGLLLMRPLLVHASSKSVTDRRRRVIHIEYASSMVLDGVELAAC
jgi:ectoine hydroxylase-related dioxygenase (phytanoyl-CoA dioxygenase family)